MPLSPNPPLNHIPSSPLRELPDEAGLRLAHLDQSEQAPQVERAGLQLWLRRVLVLLFVFLCAVVGVLLVILPWRPEWTDNYFLLGSPWLRAFVASGFVRGLCSGLGVLDIWVGFWEAVHYHEEQPS